MSNPALVWWQPVDVHLTDGHTCVDKVHNRAYALHRVRVADELNQTGPVAVKPAHAIKEIVYQPGAV